MFGHWAVAPGGGYWQALAILGNDWQQVLGAEQGRRCSRHPYQASLGGIGHHCASGSGHQALPGSGQGAPVAGSGTNVQQTTGHSGHRAFLPGTTGHHISLLGTRHHQAVGSRQHQASLDIPAGTKHWAPADSEQTLQGTMEWNTISKLP